VQAVRDLHQTSDDEWCDHDGFAWPCRTRRTLDGDLDDILAERRRLTAAVQAVREEAEKAVSAPCSCNAIAYRILAALDGERDE
jgi:hypothetical protein